jgi:hypothetical protein
MINSAFSRDACAYERDAPYHFMGWAHPSRGRVHPSRGCVRPSRGFAGSSRVMTACIRAMTADNRRMRARIPWMCAVNIEMTAPIPKMCPVHLRNGCAHPQDRCVYPRDALTQPPDPWSIHGMDHKNAPDCLCELHDPGTHVAALVPIQSRRIARRTCTKTLASSRVNWARPFTGRPLPNQVATVAVRDSKVTRDGDACSNFLGPISRRGATYRP